MSADLKGPWTLSLRESCVALVDANGQEILFIQRHPERGQNGSVTARGRTNEEIDAIASAISALPELLAALRALMAWSDHESLTGLPDDAPVADSAPSFDATVKMIHAALAKAAGYQARQTCIRCLDEAACNDGRAPTVCADCVPPRGVA